MSASCQPIAAKRDKNGRQSQRLDSCQLRLRRGNFAGEGLFAKRCRAARREIHFEQLHL